MSLYNRSDKGIPLSEDKVEILPTPIGYDATHAANLGLLFQVLKSLELADGTQHTADTPRRLLRYLEYWTDTAPDFTPTTFRNINPVVDQMIVVAKISFWSCCSHHLLPFHGHISVGYVPDSRLIGLSKIPQIVRWLAHKPQVQEHLTHEIADYLQSMLDPKGIAVHIKAVHTCQMMSVGPDVPPMLTTDLRGVMMKPTAKAEFLQEVYA
jgi:GTP cyclohydrolase I